MKKAIIIALFTLLSVATMRADEGMWLVQSIDKALEKNMRARGLKLSANEIYNADAEGASLTDAVVSLEFGCSGSMISKEGLMITNHHCAYSDVFNLSTEEHNYLKDGFWAMNRAQEISIPGKQIFFLKSVEDITDYVKDYLKDQGEVTGMRMRRVVGDIEEHLKKPGLENMFYSMWSGEKYYMAYYVVYSDVRLVAAPPTSLSAFGGDIDNWDWPQHKGDFALYRIYTAPDGKPAKYSEDNIPLQPTRTLTISSKGYKPGSFSMVIGYPGTTERYSSSAKIDYLANTKLHTENQIRKTTMNIIKSAMESNPAIALKYAQRFFSLSNMQECFEGEEKCIRRFGVVDQRKEEEKELQKWIDSDPERKEKWGTLINDLWETYAKVAKIDQQLSYYRETLLRGSQATYFVYRINNIVTDFRPRGRNAAKAVPFDQKIDLKGNKSLANLQRIYENCDMRLEKELFTNSIRTYFSLIDPVWVGHAQDSLYNLCGRNADDLAEYLWKESFLTGRDAIEFLTADTLHTLGELVSDPMVVFFNDIGAVNFNQKISQVQGKNTVSALGKQYTHAVYEWRRDKGVPQYPDANSSMRITYGRVSSLNPADGVSKSYFSTVAGILEKYDPYSFDFTLTDEQKAKLEKIKDMKVNFLTDNDITGGNSGSPVMNAKGELIGLAFDGNTEGLASDVDFTEGYNKCVCVDIRYVLWIIDNYIPYIRSELTIK
ncbi:MAG: S46 family peptidase [Bacteroidales bacterium]|nr:S46 family peptidase [Bacteroidales bacterium]